MSGCYPSATVVRYHRTSTYIYPISFSLYNLFFSRRKNERDCSRVRNYAPLINNLNICSHISFTSQTLTSGSARIKPLPDGVHLSTALSSRHGILTHIYPISFSLYNLFFSRKKKRGLNILSAFFIITSQIIINNVIYLVNCFLLST